MGELARPAPEIAEDVLMAGSRRHGALGRGQPILDLQRPPPSKAPDPGSVQAWPSSAGCTARPGQAGDRHQIQQCRFETLKAGRAKRQPPVPQEAISPGRFPPVSDRGIHPAPDPTQLPGRLPPALPLLPAPCQTKAPCSSDRCRSHHGWPRLRNTAILGGEAAILAERVDARERPPDSILIQAAGWRSFRRKSGPWIKGAPNSGCLGERQRPLPAGKQGEIRCAGTTEAA